MQTTLLSSKGQIIIPKALREARHWYAGTRLQVQETSEGLLLKPVASAERVPIAEGLAAIRKHIAYQGAAVSVDGMHAAILREAARKGARWWQRWIPMWSFAYWWAMMPSKPGLPSDWWQNSP